MSISTWNKLAATPRVGATSILVGVVAMAVAVEAHQQHEPLNEIASTTPDTTAGSEVRTSVLPKLAGHAVFNQGRGSPGANSVTQAPASESHLASNGPSRTTALRQPGEVPVCRSSWRPLESGPVGRMVADICPDQASNLLLPPQSVDPSHDKLPTVADFVQPIVSQPIATFGADGNASSRLAASLEQTLEKPLPETTKPDTVPATQLGALDWAPTS